MAHNRYPCTILDVLHQSVAPPWDDEVNVLVEVEQGRYFRTGLDGLDVGFRECSFGETACYCTGEEGGRVRRFFTAFEDCGVSCGARQYQSS